MRITIVTLHNLILELNTLEQAVRGNATWRIDYLPKEGIYISQNYEARPNDIQYRITVREAYFYLCGVIETMRRIAGI